MNVLLAKDLAFSRPILIDPSLPKLDAGGIVRKQTGRFSARLLTGTNAGSCVEDVQDWSQA